MRDVNHVYSLIADYTLDLLPHWQRQKVEEHAATCRNCRQALQREQQLGRMVRETLHVVAQPSPGRLRQLMPPAPARRSLPFLSLTWQKQLAALCVALILLVSSAGLYTSNRQDDWRDSAPSFIAATATTTSEPTATLARLETTGVKGAPGTTVTNDTIPVMMTMDVVAATVVVTPSPEVTLIVPSPTATFTKAPTPIAAILSLSN
ncbi:MAG TPA: zf-HC2 domain-containing protein [Anaerolineae bacterium]